MKNDFEYVFGLVHQFFHQARIGKSLSIIDEKGITGWETWFQVEFAYFLSQHEEQPEWWRECTLDYDRRSEKEKFQCRPDFIIRKKGWRLESYVALEVKQHPSPAMCYTNMMKDLEKISKVRVSSLDIRDYFVLGIHEKYKKGELRELIDTRFQENNLEPPSDLAVRHIPRCNYSYSMF